MWLRPEARDLRVVLHYTGVLVAALAVAMIVPLVTALFLGEWDVALDYLLSIAVVAAAGGGLLLASPMGGRLYRRHALMVTATSWAVLSVAAALPLFLSGNYASYLDAAFDALSGLTTSGLTLVQDLDRMSYAHNMWRHLTHLIGGQGIIVAALSFSFGLRGGGYALYQAEGRDEQILPNVRQTARLIWLISAVYLSVGTLVLTAAHLWLGMAPVRALLHGAWISIATFDTGGFAPQSMNALYYHSGITESVQLVLMLAGTLNFHLHAWVWRGQPGELLRNIETRTLALNMTALALFTAAGLAATNLFSAPSAIVRKGVYHIISAHSGTGLQTIYPHHWTAEYGPVALVAVILAMSAGGAVSSTAGGVKALRVAVVVKTVMLRVRSAISPVSAVVVDRYHHLRDRPLAGNVVTASMIVALLYAFTYVTGAFIGSAYGYPSSEALFESVSATANVGLTAGITTPGMPTGLKLMYMSQMWAGRLEFLAVLVLFATVVSAFFPFSGRRSA